MASEISKRTDEVIKLGAVPPLKQLGFKKKSRTFHRTVGETIQAINFQANKYNEGASGSFTVNLGVYMESIAELTDGILSEAPHPSASTIWIRLGHLLPDPGDKWWQIDPEIDSKDVARDLESALMEYGMPWLDRTSSRDGMRDAFSKGSPAYFHPRAPIALEILDGNTEDASALLHSRLKDAANPGFVNQMTEWGRKYDLL
jgi:hypothetical protein